jgi:predicted nucleotide-binding protein
VIREFLESYDGSPLPSTTVAHNVLETMGVPTKALERTYDLIRASAERLGLLVEIKGKRWVRLDAASAAPLEKQPPSEGDGAVSAAEEETYEAAEAPPISPPAPVMPSPDTGKVFVTHGSNKAIVEQIKEILTFGKFTPVVSVEKESTAKPVPDKVMDDMRACYAGIVHVGTEQVLLDDKGNEHRILNPNVLIEIGAAMALYGRRFVLLVEKGVTLPSNLQGLYEVRYEGSRLDYEATMKLLKAFNEFRAAD